MDNETEPSPVSGQERRWSWQRLVPVGDGPLCLGAVALIVFLVVMIGRDLCG